LLGQYGQKAIPATIGTDASISTAINVTGFNHVAFEIPTFAVGINTASANVYCQVAANAADTFRRVKDVGIYSSNSGIQTWEVPLGVGGYTVVCRPAERFNFVKIELGGTNVTGTAGLAAKVHVHR